MSIERCIAEIRKAAGRDLTKEEAQAIEDALDAVRQRHLFAADGGDGRALDAALAAKAEELAAAAETAALIEKRNRLINLRVFKDLMLFGDEVAKATGDPALAVEARQVGINNPVATGRLSADGERLALLRNTLGGVLADLRRAGEPGGRGGELQELFFSGALEREIAAEMFELSRKTGAPGRSGNPDALKIARVLHKYRELAVDRENRAGAFIGRLDGYVARNVHDQSKIRRAGRERWKAAMREHFDMERSFPDQPADAALDATFEALATGIHIRAEGADAGDLGLAFKGPGNLARRASAHRKLHPKSAESWLAYNKEFGTGDLVTAMLQEFERHARNTALMRVFGPNPRAMRDKWLRALKEKHRADVGAVDRLNAARLRWQFDRVAGDDQVAVSPTLAQAQGVVTGLEAFKLAGAGISALGDIFFRVAELRYQGQGYLDAWHDALADALKVFPAGEQRMIGELLGAGFETQTGSLLNRYASADGIPGALARGHRLFFKWNGLGPVTDANKRGTVAAMSRWLALNRDKGFSGVNPETRRLLGQFGISEAEWDVIRAHAVADGPDGRAYVFPELIREVPDAAVAAVARDLVPGKDAAARARDALEIKLQAYFTDRAEFASPTPGAREEAILRLGTKRGTPEGFALALLAQFKSFPVTAVTKVLGRDLYGHGARSLRDALLKGEGDLLGLAHLIVSSVAMGYLIMSAKQLSRGLAPRDPREDPAGIAMAAALQGGGFGIYGDFLFGEFNRFGRGALETLAGPALGDAAQLAEIWATAIRGQGTPLDKGGEDKANAGEKALRMLLNTASSVNLPYTRMAFDHLILYQAMEAMNPGYLRRYERRLKRENNQQFFIPPSRTIPRGGGNRLFEGVR